MELVKIQTSKTNRFSGRVNISSYTISFDKEGIAEVERTVADFLIERDNSISLHSEVSNDNTGEGKNKDRESDEKSTSNQEDKDKNKDLEKEKEDSEKSIVEFSKELALLKVADLQDFCKKNSLLEEEWVSLKKLDLIKYIVDKIKKPL